MLELKERDGLARICEFGTKGGTVETPALMPVINPNQVIISPEEMAKRFGVRILITNSYIIRNAENLRQKALGKGVHKLLGFDGAVMTDSGTFQSHVYGDLKIDQKEILNFQKDIGSDIGTMLDIFIEPDEGHEEAKEKVGLTL
ncbi:MAG: tRNA-guanine transglycosylase, partial [Thermoplasmata archaeon]|nr:tRNA-guanine transglycosylase [Thermoplasmata archaeon]